MKPSRKKIERAANLIKFMVPLDGCSGWTEKGMRVTKWPKHFSKSERKLIRRIAKAVLES